MSYESRLVSQSVEASAEAVYDYARVMENLPRWASGLAAGVHEESGDWFTDSPMGRVKVSMAAANPFGVLDHDVTLPDGKTVHNALRVSPAGSGSLLVFVVLRLPGTTREAFDSDVAHVMKDLQTLKSLVESSHHR